jgi:hypothetical protein
MYPENWFPAYSMVNEGIEKLNVKKESVKN